MGSLIVTWKQQVTEMAKLLNGLEVLLSSMESVEKESHNMSKNLNKDEAIAFLFPSVAPIIIGKMLVDAESIKSQLRQSM